MLRRISVLLGTLIALLIVSDVLITPPAQAEERKPDVQFDGVLQGSDDGARKEFTFEVPKGVTQVRVATTYDRTDGTTITLGVYDPERFRGWGGGVKPSFTIGETFATPSFNPGPIPAGLWRLAMNVAHIRDGVISPYHIRVYFARPGDLTEIAFSQTPINAAPGWYRGDLHTHTGHSDAACRSLAGKSAPCPVFLTLQAAVDAGLDFIAVTDHNATSQFESLAELATYFDTLLLLPGREVTTRLGHFNLIGSMDPLETDPRAPGGGGDVNAILKAAAATGGFVSLNHPATPTNQDCLGCGWTVPNTDYRYVQGVEVVNGGSIADVAGHPDAHEAAVRTHMAFWQGLLDAGRRLTAVGGSDNHDAIQARGRSPIGPQSPVGYPTTVVYAANLSQPAILAGLRSGRVFIDMGAGRGRLLDISGQIGSETAVMGGVLHAPRTGVFTLRVHVIGAQGDKVAVVTDGSRSARVSGANIKKDDQILIFKIRINININSIRIVILKKPNSIMMISNPIYINY